ncbi:Spg4 protein [Maudiozyma humilis]|uniref:Stationary phase protein 4 n=1 Tax=Maudiozyma humilis TaxID=51915 RepID=A0AAV5RSX6_MAUHU|nr:Spg4 protein [Kazachstania humilis]
MSTLKEAFQVYNRRKHSADAASQGGGAGSHSNSGTGTTVVFGSEYRGARRASDSSVGSSASAASALSAGSGPCLVDVSKLTRAEFQEIYNSLPRGAPDNRVNR